MCVRACGYVRRVPAHRAHIQQHPNSLTPHQQRVGFIMRHTHSGQAEDSSSRRPHPVPGKRPSFLVIMTKTRDDRIHRAHLRVERSPQARGGGGSYGQASAVRGGGVAAKLAQGSMELHRPTVRRATRAPGRRGLAQTSGSVMRELVMCVCTASVPSKSGPAPLPPHTVS